MNPFIQLKTIRAILVALACFAFLPTTQAVIPAPDGGYPGNNTAEGEDALFSLINGGLDNTAVGFNALFSTTNGGFNTAVGSEAMQSNVTGTSNTAIGYQALFGTGGSGGNTAVGFRALRQDTFGSSNTAIGTLAMFFNTEGAVNTAVGHAALQDNTTGNYNAAFGFNSLQRNTTGFTNTALGSVALVGNTSGSSNTAVGYFALLNNTTGNSNIAIGDSAGLNLTTGSNNIYIGNPGDRFGESGTIRIGTKRTHTHTSIAGIYGVPLAQGAGVIVGPNGHLGTVVSSARFKEAIKPLDKASEAILALHPVSFRYKHDLDPEGIPQFGLVAEEVEKVNPDLVAHDDQGNPYTVRYDAVSAMLLNEFLKEHKKVEEQQATIAELKSTVAQQEKGFQSRLAEQQKQIEALTAGLQKVSAQVEMSRPAPQTVLNNQLSGQVARLRLSD